jgi:hypothetical protein
MRGARAGLCAAALNVCGKVIRTLAGRVWTRVPNLLGALVHALLDLSLLDFVPP